MGMLSKAIAVLILIALAVGGTIYWAKFKLIRHEFTTDSASRQFIIGNDVLEIPLNTMRFAAQREKTVLRQADLVLYWADGTGFDDTHSERFLDPAHTGQLIFVTINERALDFDMSQRVAPIY